MQISIRWNRRAIRQLEEAIAYLEKDSLTNAEKVKKEILEKIDELLLNPLKYAPDKYKINNDDSYRAFESHHYRIAYRFQANIIQIIRIRHSKMNPLHY